MHRVFNLCLFSLFYLFSFTLQAEVILTDDIIKIKDEILELQQTYEPHNLLIIFNIDNCLISQDQPIPKLDKEDIKEYIKISTTFFSKLKKDKVIFLKDLAFLRFPQILVDDKIPDTLKAINKSPILGVNYTIIQGINDIKNLDIYKTNYYQQLGIDFSNSFSNVNYLVFKEKSDTKSPISSTFYKGILSYNSNDYFTALTNFLEQVKFAPKAIIVVDNNLANLNNIISYLNLYNNKIEIKRYHYNIAEVKSNLKNMSLLEVKAYWQGFIDKINNSNFYIDKKTK